MSNISPEVLKVLKDAKRWIDLGFNFEGDVYGVWSNDAGDTVQEIERIIKDDEEKK